MSKSLSARIMLAGGVASALVAIGGLFVYAASTYTGINRAVKSTPRLERRVDRLDLIITWYLPAIAKKLQIPAPPPALLAEATDEEARH